MIARPAAMSTAPSAPPSRMYGTWARKIRIASALTNPVMTERGTNRMSRGTRSTPSAIWMTPARTPAASRYSTPWSFTSETTTSAIAPVAAEIIAGRPPAMAIVTAIVNDA